MPKRLQDLTRDEFIELMQKFGYDNTDDIAGEYFDATEDDAGFKAFNDDSAALLKDYKLWLETQDWANS